MHWAIYSFLLTSLIIFCSLISIPLIFSFWSLFNLVNRMKVLDWMKDQNGINERILFMNYIKCKYSIEYVILYEHLWDRLTYWEDYYGMLLMFNMGKYSMYFSWFSESFEKLFNWNMNRQSIKAYGWICHRYF